MTRGNVIVVGGGFYGCAIACHLAEQGRSVTLLERGPALMCRASYANQARLHNGYHYPRSFRTAIRSRANLPQFRKVYGDAIDDGFRMLYAISRFSSNVDAVYFRQFCRAAGCVLEPAGKADRALFDTRLVQDVFLAHEPAFNAKALRDIIAARLSTLGVDVRCNTHVASIAAAGGGKQLLVRYDADEIAADWVLNCTYAALNHVDGRPAPDRHRHRHRHGLVHKITEIVLIEPPATLSRIGITVMDGPFFSTMPFPARGLHSLTHVRHSHHTTWSDGSVSDAGLAAHDPLDILDGYLSSGGGPERRSRAPWMIRDAQRFVPQLAQARVVDRLYEVKSLVLGTDFDDARPIYFHRDVETPNLISILGGKIDNIFDILVRIDDVFASDDSGTMNV